ncbi:MAG: hypothetical protein Q8Q73_15680 [Stagnimonas sp.]|nr:hypothetical protein [Stagnimonas sp.]
MNLTPLAQSTLPYPELAAAALWTELDAAMKRIPAQWVVHGAQARSYRLLNLELQISLDAEGASARWLSDSPVLNLRTRMELAQTAHAWLQAISALRLPAPAVVARVQTAPSLLAAGFASVAVRGASELGAPLAAGGKAGMALAA